MRARLLMAWCALRGGHWMTLKRRTSSDILLECANHPAACGYTALIVMGPPKKPVGVAYHGFHMDETANCPDCGNPPETHQIYKDGKCPVIRIPPLERIP